MKGWLVVGTVRADLGAEFGRPQASSTRTVQAGWSTISPISVFLRTRSTRLKGTAGMSQTTSQLNFGSTALEEPNRTVRMGAVRSGSSRSDRLRNFRFGRLTLR